MEIDRLRAWVRRDLPPKERRQVTRWLLRNADPSIPDLVQGLIREWEEEQADARVVARRPAAAAILDAWRWMLEQGRTALALDGDTIPGLVLQSDEEDAPEALVVRDGKEDVQVEVWLDRACFVAVFVTPDGRDEVVTLIPPTPLAAGQQAPRHWRPEPEDGRTTFWLVQGPTPPPDSLVEALDLVRSGVLDAMAVRWWPSGDPGL